MGIPLIVPWIVLVNRSQKVIVGEGVAVAEPPGGNNPDNVPPPGPLGVGVGVAEANASRAAPA